MLKFLGFLFGALFLLASAGAGGGLFVLYHFGRDLPDFDQLATYQPPVMTRVHTADGSLRADSLRGSSVSTSGSNSVINRRGRGRVLFTRRNWSRCVARSPPRKATTGTGKSEQDA